MLYIVSGFMRSGTSMMMDAISAGGRSHGLRCEWSRERDEMMNRIHADAGFTPNESYREVPLQEYISLTFPLQYDECLIKIMSWGLREMRKIPHRIVFMVRDPLEIAESMERSFGHGPVMLQDGIKQDWRQNDAAWRVGYWRQMKAAIVAAETRVDCQSLTILSYEGVLRDPLGSLQRLPYWPIDAKIAASVINPEKKRVA